MKCSGRFGGGEVAGGGGGGGCWCKKLQEVLGEMGLGFFFLSCYFHKDFHGT